MTRIVYGVSGEGSGHSSRARELAAHLIDLGHEVKLVSIDNQHRMRYVEADVPPGLAGFLQDLASAKAVMATAGFTLISESLQLGKPYLAMPMDGQYEQQL